MLSQIAGVFIILMGLHFLGVFKIALLNREARFHQESRPVGLLGAYGIGLAFAFGWTPCIGPVLATILTIAASEQDVARGPACWRFIRSGWAFHFCLQRRVSEPSSASLENSKNISAWSSA